MVGASAFCFSLKSSRTHSCRRAQTDPCMEKIFLRKKTVCARLFLLSVPHPLVQSHGAVFWNNFFRGLSMFGPSFATSFADPAAHRANSVARVIGEGVRARLSKLRVADLDAKPSSHPPGARRQRGETLIGLLLATGIAAAALGVAIEMQQRAQERLDAQHGGVLLAQTADGLRRLISAVPGNPALLPAAAQSGVNWLKAPACGGLAANPPQGFVPCSFGDNFWTPAFNTTFTNVAGRVEARLTFVVPTIYSRPRAGVLADIIAEHANANMTTSVVNAPAPGVITPGFVTVMSHVRPADNNLSNRLLIRANVADPDFARLVVSVSNDPSTDAFLRTDGTNRMNAALNLNNNNLVNGNNLQAVSATLSGMMQSGSANITGNMTAATATANTLTLNAGATGGAVLGAGCPTNGQVASTATGMLLACQSNTWMSAGVERTAGGACTRQGALAELADGTTMICQGSLWIPLQARMGGLVQMASFLVRSGGPPVPQPRCADIGGTPRIFVKPRAWFDGPINLTVDGANRITAAPRDDPWFYGATVSGGNWIINIQAPGGRGVPQAEAIAITACAFS